MRVLFVAKAFKVKLGVHLRGLLGDIVEDHTLITLSVNGHSAFPINSKGSLHDELKWHIKFKIFLCLF